MENHAWDSNYNESHGEISPEEPGEISPEEPGKMSEEKSDDRPDEEPNVDSELEPEKQLHEGYDNFVATESGGEPYKDLDLPEYDAYEASKQYEQVNEVLYANTDEELHKDPDIQNYDTYETSKQDEEANEGFDAEADEEPYKDPDMQDYDTYESGYQYEQDNEDFDAEVDKDYFPILDDEKETDLDDFGGWTPPVAEPVQKKKRIKVIRTPTPNMDAKRAAIKAASQRYKEPKFRDETAVDKHFLYYDRLLLLHQDRMKANKKQ